MQTITRKAQLIYAASSQSADLFYATRFDVPDPVLWFRCQSKSYLLLSPLEVDRGRQSAAVDHVYSMDEVAEACRSLNSVSQPQISDLAIHLCQKHHIGEIAVPPEFPLFLADALRGRGIKVTVRDPFFNRRRKKTSDEVRYITRGLRQAEAGLKRGLEVIAAASIRKNRKLHWGGGPLTSERLRFEIEQAVRLKGGVPDHTIVAGGIQSCDPHERGRGVLKAGETIILDIFPFDQDSRYFGDLTRTVVKGRASESQRHLFHTVKRGQKSALNAIKAGIDGKKLQDQVKASFTQAGYPTEVRNGHWVGFFHGLGHGLGLDIHESPRIAAGKLRVGDAITVEPGLYYPDIGGVRLENVVIVGSTGNQDLTRAPYRFEIP